MSKTIEAISQTIKGAMALTHQSKSSGDFIILEQCEGMDLVQFLNTGTKQWFPRQAVAWGTIKDPMTRDRWGVGYTGAGIHRSTTVSLDGTSNVSPAYRLWKNMIQRCYSGLFPAYKNTVVDERWHNFQNFCNDLPSLPGYDQWMAYHAGAQPNIIDLDKDILSPPGHKLYSRETCQFVTRSQNLAKRWADFYEKREAEMDYHPA